MKAVDFYAGIGGWALGLKMAGLDVVKSYELWDSAINTHELNLGTPVSKTDIRELKLEELPTGIKIVVGSPPCTQFSYSNRGGSGDIADGLVDIEKFLEIIAHIKPDYWAMENVPRVKKILDKELKPGGALARFRSLGIQSEVVDMSEFGVPQRRKRCIAGNFDFNLLFSYRDTISTKTMGQVVDSLKAKTVVDPNYGISLKAIKINDHLEEEPLNDEEVRCNQEWKNYHPVYNDMSFPDPLDVPSRTITATCTRVSRESIIIRNGGGLFRRLTVRERGCLQSFPISYQFHGKSYSQKLKMVGNAIPPLFTFYVAQAMQGNSPASLLLPEQGIQRIKPPKALAPVTRVDQQGHTYPATRRFWFALPNLRFKSGCRFDLVNEQPNTEFADWVITFWHGNSKDIKELVLQPTILRRVLDRAALKQIRAELNEQLIEIELFKNSLNPNELQAVWAHKEKGTHPFEILDTLGNFVNDIVNKLSEVSPGAIEEIALSVVGLKPDEAGGKKIRTYAPEIVAGLLIGSKFNVAPFSKKGL